MRSGAANVYTERMFEVSNPLLVFVDDDGDGLAHIAAPEADRFLCGRPVGASRRLHGSGTHSFQGCWACLDAQPPP